MSFFQNNIDFFMCLAWIITYTLVLFSMLKTNQPVMPPMACAVIFPWEFVAVARNILFCSSVNYAVIAQVCFAILDAAIMCVLLFKLRYYNKRKLVLYLIFVFANSCLISWAFTIANGMFYLSYICSIIGVSIWVAYTARAQYQRTDLNLHILMMKLCADVLGMLVYYDYDTVGLVLSVLHVLVDIAHVAIFFVFAPNDRKNNATATDLK